MKKNISLAINFFLILMSFVFSGCSSESFGWNQNMKDEIINEISTDVFFYHGFSKGEEGVSYLEKSVKKMKMGETCAVSDFPASEIEKNHPGYIVSSWKYLGCTPLPANELKIDSSLIKDVSFNEDGSVKSLNPKYFCYYFDATLKYNLPVKYKVHHYFMALDGATYVLDDSKTLECQETGYETTTVVARQFEGFDAESFAQIVLDPDPDVENIVSIKYTRKSGSVSIDSGIGTWPFENFYQGLYESPLPVFTDPVTSADYIFEGWQLDGSEDIVQLPETMPPADLKYVAKYRNLNTYYTVERQIELPEGGYKVFDSQQIDAKEGDSTAYDPDAVSQEIKNKAEFSLSDSSIPAQVGPDGSTVVKLVYKLKTVKVYFDLNGGSTKTTLLTDPAYPDGGYLTGKVGAKMNFDSTLTRSGAVFEGWVDVSGNPVTIPDVFPDQNTEFIAKWSPVMEAVTITVTLPAVSSDYEVSVKTSVNGDILDASVELPSGVSADSYTWFVNNEVIENAGESIVHSFAGYAAGIYEVNVIFKDKNSNKQYSGVIEVTVIRTTGN